jgi:DNA polymerase-3 subunit beta
MEFVLAKEIAAALFSKAAGTIPTKDVTPILKNFLIKVANGRIQVLATDMELGALADTSMARIVREGTTAAPAKKLQEMVATAQEGDICFRLMGTSLHVFTAYHPAEGAKEESFKTEWTVYCMDPDTYPDFPVYKEDAAVTVDCKKFVTGLDRISFAASDNEMKVNLMAVYINDNRMYAADGHRACRFRFESGLTDFMIPAPAVKLLVQLLRNAGVDSVSACKTPNHLLFKVGADIYHARQLEAQFPPVEDRVFKETDSYGDKLIIEDREELQAAILRSRITSEEESKLLTLKLDEISQIDPNTLVPLTVTSRNNMDERCTELLKVIWSGKPFERSVNWEYVLDVLKVLTEKRVAIRMGQDVGKIKTMYRIDEGDQTLEGGFSSVILPVRPKKEKTESEKEAEALLVKDKEARASRKRTGPAPAANGAPPAAPSVPPAPPDNIAQPPV